MPSAPSSRTHASGFVRRSSSLGRWSGYVTSSPFKRYGGRMNKYDHELGMSRPISRRDFLNGLAIGFGGVMTGGWRLASATQGAQDSPDYYPPALTGMRGSHDGSFEAAHELLNGTFWNTVGTPIDTKEAYDLIVVGGGISGLAAAYFYR